MDFGGGEDCPFDTLGSVDGHTNDFGVEPQQPSATLPQPSTASVVDRPPQQATGTRPHTNPSAGPPNTQGHVPLTQSQRDENPFAAESGDFTLSGDASLEATQNDDANRPTWPVDSSAASPTSVPPPTTVAAAEPPVAPTPATRTQPSPVTATPHTSVQRAAVGNKVVPKVLAHNPFEAHDGGDDPFASTDDHSTDAFAVGHQRETSSTAPAWSPSVQPPPAAQASAPLYQQQQQPAAVAHPSPQVQHRYPGPPQMQQMTAPATAPPQQHQQHQPPSVPALPSCLSSTATTAPQTVASGHHAYASLPPLPMQPIMPPGFASPAPRSASATSQASLDGSQRHHSEDRWGGGGSSGDIHHQQHQQPLRRTPPTEPQLQHPQPHASTVQPPIPAHTTPLQPVVQPGQQEAGTPSSEPPTRSRGHERNLSEGAAPIYQHIHHQHHEPHQQHGSHSALHPQAHHLPPRGAHHASFDAQKLVPRSDSAPAHFPQSQPMASQPFHHSINGHAHVPTPEQLAGGGAMQRAESQQFYDTSYHQHHHHQHHHHHALQQQHGPPPPQHQQQQHNEHSGPQHQYHQAPPAGAPPHHHNHVVPQPQGQHWQQHHVSHEAYQPPQQHEPPLQQQPQYTPFQVAQDTTRSAYHPPAAGYDLQQQASSSGTAHPSSACSVERLLSTRRKGFVGCYGLGGRLFHAVATGPKPCVSACSVHHLLSGPAATDSGRSYVKAMASLPGCLTPSTKADTVLKALGQVPNVSPVLVAMLQTMCTKSMDWVKGGQHELIKMLQAVTSSGPGADPTTPMVPVYNEAAPQPFGQQEALSTIQKLMTAGDRQEAVRCALHYKMHSHALLIAMMCDTKDVYQHVVSTIIKEQLDPRTPLASAYCAFNELPPPDVPAEMRDSTLSQWPHHVAMLVANFTREAGESLLQLGDQLLEAGRYDCAHVCYLVAQLSPAARPGPQAPPKAVQVAEALRSRYLLLGGHYQRTKCRAALLQPHTVFLTEVLEFSRQRENEKFVRVQLIPFRVMMAELYAELGMSQQAESYLQHMGKLLPSSQPRKDDFATRNVAEVVDAIRKRTTAAQQAAHGASSGGQKSAWWPFGGAKTTSSASAASAAKPGGGPSAGTISRASSVNPTVSSRSSSATSQQPQQQQTPMSTAQAQPAATTQPAPSSAEPDAKQPTEGKSRWGLGGLFRRGGSQPAAAAPKKLTAAEEKEAKAMIIDTEAPPTYDAATGRWLFQKSKEELAVDEQIRAGPPKLPTPTTPGTPIIPGGNAPPISPAGGPPMAGGGPPPPPGFAAGPPAQRKYVDMFNS